MHILHLEDSEPDAELVATFVRDEWPHCRITRIANRDDYDAALRVGGFDLILSDYTLPGYDGLSALELANARCPSTPFIFISGTIGEERAIEALKSGAVDYVLKDRPARLIPAIRSVLIRIKEEKSRRGAEDALRHHQERFRQITENVTDLIALLDLEGRRIYQNPACQRVFGDLEPGRSTPFFDFLLPEDRARFQAAFSDTAKLGQGPGAEYRFILADDTVRHIEASKSVIRDQDGKVSSLLFVGRDITERRRAEAQIREQASLLDKARDAICVTDAFHRITYWNASAERLYGWSAAEALDQGQRGLLFARDAARFQAARTQVLATGEWHGELRPETRNGEIVVVESSWTLVSDASGEPQSILCIDTDVTEQRKLAVQLLQSQRLENIGMLAGGIAHDLNNMLAPILISTELLAEQAGQSADHQLIEMLATSAQHGADLVRQILAFARGADGQRSELQVRHLIDDSVKFLRQTLPRSITIEADYKDRLWLVQADATQLKQVLLNLCVNARDAMPEGGRIEICSANVASVPVLSGPVQGEPRPGPYLHLSVTDTGTGIPPELLTKIFDPFFTTKEASKGTGLGLSTVSGIIKSHGGLLQVESTLGRGTAFHIYLPALAEQAAPAPASAPRVLPVGRGETILLVDDDSAVGLVTKTVLTSRGYRVIYASDGMEALDEFASHRAEIALVISDLMMPGIDGGELARLLRAQAPALKIIITSGLVANGAADSANLPPNVAVLAKPLTAESLLTTIRRVLDGPVSA